MPRPTKVNVTIVGASGYSGEELTRLVLRHPELELAAVTSRQTAGQKLNDVFQALPRKTDLVFTSPEIPDLIKTADVFMLALPHGVAAGFAEPLVAAGKKVFDLSADFRLRSADVYKEFYGQDHPAPALLEKAVYGSPEWHKAEIKSAQLVACPGCYPTSILLPTLPLIKAGVIVHDRIIADSMSGVSGAGRKADIDFLFVECNESLRAYSVPKHRHLSEIEQELNFRLSGTYSSPSDASIKISFTPHLVPVNRGIHTTLYFDLDPMFIERSKLTGCEKAISAIYQETYANEPFVRLLTNGKLPDTKNVMGSNFIEIAWRFDARTNRLIVLSAIDNIVKGASGQAIQALNIMYGWDETTGLH